MTTAAQWWHHHDDQLVCTLCPRECSLHEGQRGFCFVRQNIASQMVLTTYGRSSGFCIDPIEKKPLNHFLPGTPVLSFGTAGCNLGCKFCQNWETSKAREFDESTDFASPEAIAQAALKHGCRSVAFTYNDPVIWAEYAIDTARACHEVGIKTVAVTAGYISPEARGEFYSVMDAANVDLKAFTPEFYKFITLSKLEPVLDTLRWLKHESNVWFEITNLMIPGENDSPDETARMCDWIVEQLGPDVPVHFTAFHPDFRMQDIPRTPEATLQGARQQALAAGIKFPYVGNVHDVAGQSTYCPVCQSLLIERDWYELGRYALEGNRCRACGETIPGVFDPRPGHWGAKRQPIRISEPVVVPLSLSMRTQDPQTSNTVRPAMSSSNPPNPNSPSNASWTTGAVPLQVDFTEAEATQIATHARAVADAVLHDRSLPVMKGPLASTPAYGMFVTFRHGNQLRACKGQFGELAPLGTLLNAVVKDSATNDPRFNPLQPEELPRLQLEVSLMFNPRQITSRGEARLHEVVIGKHGLVISNPRGRGLLLPQVATEQHWDALTFLKGICRKANLHQDAWKSDESELMTFEARLFHFEPTSSGAIVRPAARAGQFYPADPEAMRREIADFMVSSEPVVPVRVRAVMLPHAGWTYCGEVMGQTVARIEVPRQVIIVGPKHTPVGPPFSVSNADAWQIPGAQIPIATDLRARLLELLPALECESAAHSQEHAVEVILPFLQARNPSLTVLPLVLGGMSYSQTEQFAQALQIVCRESSEPILMVISSDMNHFASDAENRRLDFLAIEAMRSGDAGQLFDVVHHNRISMCGVMPAVTILRALNLSGTLPHPQLVKYDNSGTASGDLNRVVGYAGMVIP